MIRYRILPSTTLLVAALLAAPTYAVPVSWVAGDGAWEQAAAWSTGALPGDEDFVEILFGGAVGSTAVDNVAAEVLNASALTVSAGLLTVHGTLDTSGAFSVIASGQADLGRIFVQAPGTLYVAGAAARVDVLEGVFNAGTWTMTSGATLTAESFDNFATFDMSGVSSVAANSMINHASAVMNLSGADTYFVIAGNLTNDGAMNVLAGAHAQSDSIDNTGSVLVDDARLDIDSAINEGSIVVRGADARWNASDVVTNTHTLQVDDGATAALHTVVNEGAIRVNGGHLELVALDNEAGASVELRTAATAMVADLTLHSGVLVIDATSRLDSVRFQQLDGTTLITGGVLASSGAAGIDVSGGTLSGHGTIDGTLTTSGDAEIQPGVVAGDIGQFTITGDLRLLDGTVLFDIAGTAFGEFDRFVVGGMLELGGTFALNLGGGFAPSQGETFDLITGASLTGTFATLLLPDLGGGLAFKPLYTADTFRLTVVPVPAPLLLLLAGLTGLLTVTRVRPAAA